MKMGFKIQVGWQGIGWVVGRSENQNSKKINNGECFFVSWYI